MITDIFCQMFTQLSLKLYTQKIKKTRNICLCYGLDDTIHISPCSSLLLNTNTMHERLQILVKIQISYYLQLL
jgi:hypothetical protein